MSQIPSTIPWYSSPQTQSVPAEPTPTTPADPIVAPTQPTDPGMDSGGTPPLITSDQSSGDWYSESALDGEYDIDMGLLQAPVAGPAGTPCEIIAVHAPMATRELAWTVERVNSPPTAPHWQTSNPNEILFRKKIRPASWTMGPDGTKIWRLSGVYVYALFLPPGDSDPLWAGVPAYASEAPSSANVQASQFSMAASDASSTTPAGFTLSGLT